MSIPIDDKTQSSSKEDSKTVVHQTGESETDEKSSDGDKIGSNILSLGTGEVIARIVAFFGTAYAARVLGPENFGIVGFATAIFSYFSIAVSGGLNDVGVREVARRPLEASSIASNVIAIRLAMAVIGISILGMTVWFLDKPPTVKLVILLTGLLLFSLAFDTSWVYKGLGRNHPVSVALILSQILFAAGIFLTIRQPDDVVFMPLSQFIGEIIAGFVLTIPLFWLGKIKIDWREGFNILRSSGFWAVSRMMRAVMYSFDVLLIAFWIGVEAVGYYNAPYRICFLLVAIAVSIHTSFLPIITHAAIQDSPNAAIGKIAERALYFAAAVAAPLVVGGIIIAEPLLEAVFGSEYREGGVALRFLLLSIGFVFLYGSNHNIFLAVNLLKTEMVIFGVAAAVNVGLNILIIPRYGIVGAAAVTALAEALTLVLEVIIINRIGVPYSLKSIWKPLLASGGMGAVLLAFGKNHSLIFYLVTAFVVYLTALVLLRGIPKDMRRFFAEAAPFFQ
jgi:O-antigen/teichoic acid export membrane protein